MSSCDEITYHSRKVSKCFIKYEETRIIKLFSEPLLGEKIP